MSSQQLHTSYRWTADEMVTAQLVHTIGTQSKYRWLRVVALGSMLLVATLLVMRQGVFDMRIFGLVLIAYIGVVISEVTRHPKWIERSARRMFNKHVDQGQRVRFTIDAEAIHANTEGVGEGRTAWVDIHKIIETQDGFLLYLNKQVFLWIPRRAFRPKSDLKQFRKLITKNECDYTKLS